MGCLRCEAGLMGFLAHGCFEDCAWATLELFVIIVVML